MKKLLILILGLILFINTSYSANAEVSKEGKVKKEVDATSEEILLKLVEPKLNNIITEKYGKEMSWHIEKANRVHLILDHTKNPSDVYYKMRLAVRLTDPEVEGHQFLLDFITIRLDNPSFSFKNRYKETSSDMKVKLIKYEQLGRE
ncbi:DUF3888 domain-containing protein [Bacillus sp. AFS040349]|uniref:DUF3888 domain-containing protein n=1 Tax=Bacillus sp. AFS040349 TaxID=2033502 RepID=UPI000BFBEBDF|nr:DUF3888 domain-containing protein [Bacillus sp. AFS040349]PGT88239.1 hypothetical protein COD11_05960 [Bacillus sp. AFS040349]